MKTTVTEIRPCPNCGKPMPVAALAGLCPACLLAQAGEPESGPPHQGKGVEPLSLGAVAKLFPQLEILGSLGAGGMGAVYKARQPALDRLVALKILPPKNGEGGDFEERFNREARALARLSHPNIIAVHEFGKVDDQHFFLMEFVDGANLRQLERAGRLSPREALQLIPQICDALQYAHDEGVVHRDIKPENVLVDRKGRVKIADFGLARIVGQDEEEFRLTREGQIMGTPHYMAPEQVEHPLSVDHRADIYSLGVVLYEMLTGDLPLGHFPPPSHRVQVDVRLDNVVLRALQNDPDRRYQHVSEVKTQVENITSTPGTPQTPQAPEAEERFPGSRRFALTVERNGTRVVNWKPVLALVIAVFGLVSIATFVMVFDSPWMRAGYTQALRTHVAVPHPETGVLVAKMAGGRSIQLLGVAEADAAPGEWWRPDGRALTNTAIQVHGPADMLAPNSIKRELAFTLEGLPLASDALTYDFGPGANISAGGELLLDGQRMPGGWPMRVAWPASTRSPLIRVGFALETWRTVMTHDPSTYKSTPSSQPGDPKWTTGVHQVTDDGTNLHLTILLGPDTKNWRMRVVAVDQGGAIRTHQKASGTLSESATTWTFSFEGLAKDGVKEFRVQVCPLEWAEFRNVALHLSRNRPTEAPNNLP